MKKKVIAGSLSGIALVIILILVYPLVKLEVISKNYQGYGSYVYFPGETSYPVDTKPVNLKTQTAAYRVEGIKLTNVVYYPGLKQLAFGYIFSDDRQEKYDIALVDAEGRNVPGRLLISGSERFYAKDLQKLNFMLEEPLEQQAAYTILVRDEQGEQIGSLDFAARLR